MKIIVIGSGFGGLGAACRLAAKGHDVTLLEKRDKLGGRAYQYEINGFKFDGGPTVMTVPAFFDEIFELAGRLPDWLQGTLIRNGPGTFEVGTDRYRHWFDGLAMLHKFSFEGGRVSYANKFLDTRSYRAAMETGRIAYSEFATDPCRSIFSRIQSIFDPQISDSAKVNVAKIAERYLALAETPIQDEIILDIDAYEDASIIQAWYLDKIIITVGRWLQPGDSRVVVLNAETAAATTPTTSSTPLSACCWGWRRWRQRSAASAWPARWASAWWSAPARSACCGPSAPRTAR